MRILLKLYQAYPVVYSEQIEKGYGGGCYAARDSNSIYNIH